MGKTQRNYTDDTLKKIKPSKKNRTNHKLSFEDVEFYSEDEESKVELFEDQDIEDFDRSYLSNNI